MLITTERLILREFRIEDWRTLLQYQSDPDFLLYYHWTRRTPADVRGLLQVFISWQYEQPRSKYQLAIESRREGRLIGNIGIRKKEPGASEAEMGYELDRAYWGHGYATEAGRAMLDLAFNTLRLHRVWAGCVAENTASAAVMRRLGMQYEGRLRENDYIKGRWHDTLLHSILEQEWRETNGPET